MKKLQYERPLIQRLNTGVMNKFGTKTEYAPVTHIDGVSVKEMINEFGSPIINIRKPNKKRKGNQYSSPFQYKQNKTN